jgi:hypothetical protein
LLSGAPLGAILGLWKAALGQLRGPALESSFEKQLWRPAFGNSFGEQLCEQLWEQLSEPLCEAAFGTNFGEHLIVRKESRASDWYCRLPIFMFFSFWGVRFSARLGTIFASIC